MQEFEFALEDNLFALQEELTSRTYKHSAYQSFYVRDPKLRHIHKASVRDRVVHQAIFRILYQVFDKSFIFDSYSCRVDKGTHAAIERLVVFARRASSNNTRTLFALKCDVKKFFDSIDQNILFTLLRNKIQGESALWLMHKIIQSFKKTKGKGLPLGNVTSQLFANIYLNELDWHIKRTLKIKYYLCYCDDFIILSEGKDYLFKTIKEIKRFLGQDLRLCLHEKKITIRKYRQGIDFLGYVVRPHYKILRTKTKRRIFKKLTKGKYLLERGDLSQESFAQSLQSYLGVLKHCKGFKIKRKIFR